MIDTRMPRRLALRGTFLVAVAATFLLGALFGTAFAEPAPVNTALPAISPSPPVVGQQANASTGTWTSKAAAHWFACTEQSGGKYANSECANEGSPGKWESVRLPEGEKRPIAAALGSLAVSTEISGVAGTFACEVELSAAEVQNPSGGAAGKGTGTLQLKGCKAEGKNWTACKVTSGGAVAVKLTLTKLEGRTDVSIAPQTGSVLASLTLSGCKTTTLNGTRPLTGAALGTYSNSASRIEFGGDTVASETLWFNGWEVTGASGSLGITTTAGGHVKADSVTYTYAWNRCEPSCKPITGATGSGYTPVEADRGKQLSVSVTATDPFGSTTATSGAISVIGKLSWYRCGEAAEGKGVYEDAGCTTKGSKDTYSWLSIGSTPFTSTNVLNKEGQTSAQVLTFWASGIQLTITCTQVKGAGTLVNTASRAEISEYNLTMSNCTMTGGCRIGDGSGGHLGEISLKGLTAHSPQAPETLASELKVELAGTTEATYYLEGCSAKSLNHAYTLQGWIPMKFDNKNSRLYSTSAEVLAAESLFASGWEVGIEGMTRIFATEGEQPLKLAIEP